MEQLLAMGETLVDVGWPFLQFVKSAGAFASVFSSLLGLAFLFVAFRLKNAVKRENEKLASTLDKLQAQIGDIAAANGSVARNLNELHLQVEELNQAAPRTHDGLKISMAFLKSEIDERMESMRSEMVTLADDFRARVSHARGGEQSTSLAQGTIVAGAVSNFDEIRELWSEARNNVRQVIEAIFDTQDGRTLRSLQNLDFRNYTTVAGRLHPRWIDNDAFEALVGMDMIFKRLRGTPTNATTADVMAMRAYNDTFRQAASDWLQDMPAEPRRYAAE